MKNRDVTFRRINGRIVPIKNRATSPAQTKPSEMVAPAVKVGAGFAVATASGFGAGSLINQSWKAYGRSAHIRGLSKGLVNRVPKKVIDQSIKDAARFKITGKVLAKRGFGILGLGLAAGAGLVASGFRTILDRKKINDPESRSSAIAAGGAAVTAAGLTVFGRKAGISHISKAIRMSGGMNVKNAFSAFTTYGRSRTSNIVRQYSKMAKKDQQTFTVKKLQRITKGSKKYNIPGQGSFNL